ncbi:unnamed protein product [Lupinus luteus]|uniref:Transcription repressor n=1 Tax=Lupinus luteus TaxID=3873 RepID=A0AAV1VZR3_LUPLU
MAKQRKQSSTTTSQSTKNKQLSSIPTSSKPKQPQQYYNPRKSYHFTRDLNQGGRLINTSSPHNQKVLNTANFHEQPRKPTIQRAKRRSSRASSPLELGFHDPDSVLLPTDQSLVLHSNNNNNNVNKTKDDIIIDVDNNSIARKDDKLGGVYDGSFSKLVLPPIVTKRSTKFNDFLSDDAKNNNNKETKPRSRMVANKDQLQKVKGESRFNTVNHSESKSLKGSLKVKIVKENKASMKEVKNSPSGGRRLRLKINSPRIRNRKSVPWVATGGRRSLSDSFVIVKSSLNPRRDFRESMVEMIVHNNIRSSKGLEDLLACYLCLNSDEYHDIIIKVFKQIWFDLSDNE